MDESFTLLFKSLAFGAVPVKCKDIFVVTQFDESGDDLNINDFYRLFVSGWLLP